MIWVQTTHKNCVTIPLYGLKILQNKLKITKIPFDNDLVLKDIKKGCIKMS